MGRINAVPFKLLQPRMPIYRLFSMFEYFDDKITSEYV